jgi:kynureninase
VLLDTFQSLGTVPVDVQALNVDFATGGVLKWLCGGPGTCYLYVRPELGRKLEPKFTGWMAHQKPFHFEIGPIRYTDLPYRFMTGTPNIAALYAARPGLKIIREAGVQAIRDKSKRQTAKLIELADRRGWPVNTPRDPEQRSGTVSIDMPHSKEVCAELLRRDVVVDWRPRAGVRFSPHFYNTDEELVRALEVVDQILASDELAKKPQPTVSVG